MIKRNAAQQNFNLSSQKPPEFYKKSYTDWAIYIMRILIQQQEFFFPNFSFMYAYRTLYIIYPMYI